MEKYGNNCDIRLLIIGNLFVFANGAAFIMLCMLFYKIAAAFWLSLI